MKISLIKIIFTSSSQKRLNEDVIDYDLLEDLVCHVDETSGGGAILVFLPVSNNSFTLVACAFIFSPLVFFLF